MHVVAFATTLDTLGNNDVHSPTASRRRRGARRDDASPMMPSACCDRKWPDSAVAQPNAKRRAAQAPPAPRRTTSVARYPEYDEPSWYATWYAQLRS